MLPEDFGLDPVRTLARVADHAPARDHSTFWSEWFRQVGGERPHLTPRAPGADNSDPTASHEFVSFDGTRIGCRLILPDEPTRAGLVTSHGYEVTTTLERDAARWRALAERGVAVLLVRLRGYPGSRRGVGDLTEHHELGGWFTRGLDAQGDAPERTMEWIVPRAVGDLADGCRALRNALYGRSPETPIETASARPPVSLHGESLGGGLAVIVAAQLVGRLRHEPMIDRLAVGLPSLGDWPWRLGHKPAGTGREVEHALRSRPDRAETIHQRLRLLDAVVHAARVRGPALAKLAERDDVVPAPTGAAVFNALGSDPGLKWRFVVPAGHAEAGLENARRHALFERCLADFFDPAQFPTQAMEPWESVLSTGDRAPDGTSPRLGAEPGETGDAPPPTLFGPDALTPDADAALIGAYERAGKTLDALPYTPEFETLLRDAEDASGARHTPRDTLHRLHNLRKAGRLPRLGRTGDRPPTIEPEQERLLSRLVIDATGSMGARDQLPHTPEFDALAERFNRETGLALSHHDLWRVVAKLAK